VVENIVHRNGYGVGIGYTKNSLAARNDIGWNDVDGLIVSHESDNVTIRENYVHDHLLYGHPDNLQFYRYTPNLKIINNLLIGAGQGIMGVPWGCTLKGNITIGSSAQNILSGTERIRDPNNIKGITMSNKTVAYSGWGCVGLYGRGEQELRENIHVTGTRGFPYSDKNRSGYKYYRGDRNLFWRMTTADGKDEDGAKWLKKITTEGKSSAFVDPGFRNAPASFDVINHWKSSLCTRDTFYLMHKTVFQIGDHVEVNFDGVVRKVVAVKDDAITVKPGLPRLPDSVLVVANWKDNSNFAMDLRLKPDSPGAKLGQNGNPVGSTINIQAFKRGDFDGDGQRDLPPLPPELAGK